MRPQRALSMSSSARLVQWKAPVRFVSTTASQSSSGMRIARPSRVMPALLTSTAIEPKRSRTSPNARSTSAAAPTSACTSPPERATVTTRWPSARRRSAIAAPMPRVPPVTTATVPSGAGMDTLLPAQHAGAPDEAGAEGGDGDRHAGPQDPVALGLMQRERDRRRGRVGDAADVEDDLLLRHAEVRGRRLDDPAVGLVGDEEVDVLDGDAG